MDFENVSIASEKNTRYSVNEKEMQIRVTCLDGTVKLISYADFEQDKRKTLRSAKALLAAYVGSAVVVTLLLYFFGGC